MKSTNDSTPAIVGALAIAIIMSAAAYVVTQSGSNSTTSVAANTQTATKETTSQTTDAAASTASRSQAAADSTTTTNSSSSSTSGYNDGTYSASADYSVPHGSNSIGVTITVKDGMVSSVKATHDYADRESGMYIDSFDSSINSAVVGKSISNLTSLSRVGGASLTTYGFDEALANIANQAKA